MPDTLEIVLMIFIGILSVYIFEKIIAKAFKAVFIGVLLFVIILTFCLYKQKLQKSVAPPVMRFTVQLKTNS